MKKIMCEHCGTYIDIAKEGICPNCKAPYNNNKEFLKYKEEQEKLGNEIKVFGENMIKNSSKLFIIPVIIFIIFIIVAVICIKKFYSFNSSNDFETNINNLIETDNVDFNYTSYEMLDEVYLSSKTDGYKYLLINFSIKNNGNGSLFVMDSNFIGSVDGVQQELVLLPFNEYNLISGFIESGYTKEGTIAYKVKEDIKSFDLSYNDKTIHIDIE